MKHALAGMLLGACAAIVIACGAARPQTMPSSVAPSAPGDPHAEIAALEKKIAETSTQLGLPSAGTSVAAVSPMAPHGEAMTANTPPASGVQPHVVGPSCQPAKTETCTNVCTLGDSICTDANRICVLANGLVGDADAAASCTRATTSCTDANARCCSCT